MHKRPNPLNRIDAMEAQLRQMQAELRALRKEPAGGTPHFVRIGKTTTDGVASYPSAPANTYGVVCQEATFTSTPGSQTPTVTDLSEDQQIVAHDLVSGRFIDEDTQVLVLKQPNGKYLLWPLSAPAATKIGVADDAIGPRATGGVVCDTGTISVYEIDGDDELADTGDNVEAYNITSVAVEQGALVVLCDAGGKWFIIENLSGASDRLVEVYYRASPTGVALPGTGTRITLTDISYDFSSNNMPVKPNLSTGKGLIVNANRDGLFQIGYGVALQAPSSPTLEAQAYWSTFVFQVYVDGVAQAGSSVRLSFYFPPDSDNDPTTYTRQVHHGFSTIVCAAGEGETIELGLSGGQFAGSVGDYTVLEARLWARPVGRGDKIDEWA